MILRIFNNLDKTSYEFEVNDERDSRLFHHFIVDHEDFKDIPEGEYTYNLLDMDCSPEGKVIATGLLQIGDFIPEKKEYDLTEENNGFYQYNG